MTKKQKKQILDAVRELMSEKMQMLTFKGQKYAMGEPGYLKAAKFMDTQVIRNTHMNDAWCGDDDMIDLCSQLISTLSALIIGMENEVSQAGMAGCDYSELEDKIKSYAQILKSHQEFYNKIKE